MNYKYPLWILIFVHFAFTVGHRLFASPPSLFLTTILVSEFIFLVTSNYESTRFGKYLIKLNLGLSTYMITALIIVLSLN